MNWFILIASLTVLLSCKQSETKSNAVNTTQPKIDAVSIPVKEHLFLSMERTPCFGRCPNYKITIMNTGKVTYNGIQFTKKDGHYSKILSGSELSKLQKKIEDISLFEMENKYDANITDIPAVALFVFYKGNKKKIFDRKNGPKELKEFEELIETIVIDDQLVEIKD
jgi:hypothetical protein